MGGRSEWPVGQGGDGRIYSLTLVQHSSWSAAEAEAVAAGGHLVAIDNTAESDWVTQTSMTHVPATGRVFRSTHPDGPGPT